jgi:hypothetical protein
MSTTWRPTKFVRVRASISMVSFLPSKRLSAMAYEEPRPRSTPTPLVRAADSRGVALPPQAQRILETSTLDSLFESLRKVGLTLEPQRAPIDMLVVDQIEKTPTEN